MKKHEKIRRKFFFTFRIYKPTFERLRKGETVPLLQQGFLRQIRIGYAYTYTHRRKAFCLQSLWPSIYTEWEFKSSHAHTHGRKKMTKEFVSYILRNKKKA